MNIAALLAGLFSGILGAMGLGGGSVLIIYLSLFTETEQLTAQGINLLFFVPIALISVIIYSFKKQVKWKTVIKISLSGLLGTLCGIGLTSLLGKGITAKLFGLLLIGMGVLEFFKSNAKNVAEKRKR